MTSDARMRSIRCSLSCFVVAGIIAAAPPLVVAKSVTVFAAASLKEAMDEQSRAFQRSAGQSVVVAYGASSALAKQIEAGAPADLFISADVDWMDYLEHRHLIVPGARFDLLRNTLVLVAPSTANVTLEIGPQFGLAAALGKEKLAMGNPDSVPAGRYGKSALEKMGVWSSVERNVVRAENVRVALALVARGEAAFGIVYGTDARADKGVRIVGTFPPGSHRPIVYPAALVAAGKSSSAKALLDYLRSPSARAIWERYGFASVQ